MGLTRIQPPDIPPIHRGDPIDRFRRGITLIELAVAVGIVGIIVAISLPAIQSSRESARQIQCQNNLRQVLIATQSFHHNNHSLPSLYNGTSLRYPLAEWDLFHMHSWRVPLLPHLEQQAIHDRIHFDLLATESANLPVAQSVIPVYVCPSGADAKTHMGWGLNHDAIDVQPPHSGQQKYRVVRSDYDAMAGIQILPNPLPAHAHTDDLRFVRWGVWGWPVFDGGLYASGNELLRYRAGRFRDIRDGLSNTIAIVERGGKPIELLEGKPHVTTTNPNAAYPGQVGWSASNNFNWAVNHSGVGINLWNARGIYSLHPGGAHVSMADGSVRFLSDSTDFDTLVKMFSRSDHD